MRAGSIPIRPWMFILALTYPASINAQGSPLPSLGDGSSSLVSLEQEYRLGRILIRQMRLHLNTMDHPIAREYLKNLIYRLAKNSQVADRRFEFLLIDTPQLNAFAAPGGIIGVNAGLFLHTNTEHEFAAVMAHELAHLSQRHYARSLEEQKKQAPLSLASLLSSFLLIASSNISAGIAGLITTKAAITQSRLSYSRDWEREADRLGIITLKAAGFDPRGMPDMFQRMLDTYRYSETPPEFLQTHPVSDKRVADAAARLDGQSFKPKPANIDFLYLRNEFIGQYWYPDKAGVAHFTQAIKQSKTASERLANQYGLAMANVRMGEYFLAKQGLEKLLKQDPNRILLQAAYGNLLIEASRPHEAVAYLKRPVNLTPNNYSLALIYAKALIHTQDHKTSVPLLKNMSLEYPQDPYVWQLKSQAHKLAKEPLLELQATAESLFLRGDTQRAIEHLKYAQQRAKDQFQQWTRIHERIREMDEEERMANL